MHGNAADSDVLSLVWFRWQLFAMTTQRRNEMNGYNIFAFPIQHHFGIHLFCESQIVLYLLTMVDR
jgi:hypothetical protein